MAKGSTVDFGNGFRLGYNAMSRVFVYGSKYPNGRWYYQSLCLDIRACSTEHRQAIRNSLAKLVRELRTRGVKLTAKEYRYASGSEFHKKFLAIN